jgi:hypothetical protein
MINAEFIISLLPFRFSKLSAFVEYKNGFSKIHFLYPFLDHSHRGLREMEQDVEENTRREITRKSYGVRKEL